MTLLASRSRRLFRVVVPYFWPQSRDENDRSTGYSLNQFFQFLSQTRLARQLCSTERFAELVVLFSLPPPPEHSSCPQTKVSKLSFPTFAQQKECKALVRLNVRLLLRFSLPPVFFSPWSTMFLVPFPFPGCRLVFPGFLLWMSSVACLSFSSCRRTRSS